MANPARLPAAIWTVLIIFVSNIAHTAIIPGPHGGRTFRDGKLAIEFTVDKDEHPHVFRLDAKYAVIPLEKMDVKLVVLIPKKAATIRLTRTIEGIGKEADEKEHLAGSTPMPPPEEYPVELTVKLGKQAKKFKFKFIVGFCAECSLPAFSCTCPKEKE